MTSDFAKVAAFVVFMVVLRFSVEPLILFFAWGPARPLDCSRTIIKRLPSQDGTRVAVIDERICEGESPVSTAITAGVEITSTTSGGPAVEMLGVDTGGHVDERPLATWSAPDVLQVTVATRSYTTVLNRHAYGVRLDLHFDTDDPAARAAWLRERGLRPGPPDDSDHKERPVFIGPRALP